MFQKITEKTFERIFPILDEAFPSTELRTMEAQKALLEEPDYTLYGVPDAEGDFRAVFGTWEIEDFLFIEHFAVGRQYRNGGFGGRLLEELAEEKGKPLVLEVEVPEDDLTKRRVGFYERHGLVLNDYPYEQPPLREENDWMPLKLMTSRGSIDEETFRRYKRNIYDIVYKYRED